MKKLFALLLAAMMMLASVSVLAEETTDAKKSVDSSDLVQVVSDASVFTVVPLGPVGETYKEQMTEAEENGKSAIDVFTPEVQEALKEKFGDNATVNEMFGLTADGWTPDKGEQYLVLEFATEYKAGEDVSAILGLVKGEGEDAVVTESILMAEVPEDYQVKVYLPVSMLEELLAADECFVVIVNNGEVA